MKTVKSILFKKYLKKRKSRARFCLSIDWLNITDKKNIKHYNSLSAGAHKVEKAVCLWPNFDPNILDIWKVCKG